MARFQLLQPALNKKRGENRKSPTQIAAAIRQLVSKAITTEGGISDVFRADCSANGAKPALVFFLPKDWKPEDAGSKVNHHPQSSPAPLRLK